MSLLLLADSSKRVERLNAALATAAVVELRDLALSMREGSNGVAAASDEVGGDGTNLPLPLRPLRRAELGRPVRVDGA